jgi:3-deoxy-D-manno-octulosonic-acid transferase
MEWLRQALAERGLAAEYRSQLQGQPLPGKPAVLVLDTMGDLRDFYAAATVAHVGVDHNVLEPLAFDKPVTVGPGWNATYPSYPVYTLLAEAGALLQAESEQALAAHWLACLGDGGTRERQGARARQALAAAAGATARHLAALQPHLAALRPR